MAGRGTHLRPHTLSTVKSLIKIVGKSVVYRTIENLVKLTDDPIEEIAFIIKEANQVVEDELLYIASQFNAECKIFYQRQPKGTAHAILCAKESLQGNVLIAFTDRLFEVNESFNRVEDAIVWVKQVEKPQKHDIVKINESQLVTGFFHKPKDYVSEFALIGIYYFKKAEVLLEELTRLKEEEIVLNGEYQLISALIRMREKGISFVPAFAESWFEMSNKQGIIKTSQKYLDRIDDFELINEDANVVHSIIINPSFIGANVHIENSVIGPYACIEKGTSISNSVIQDSIIGENCNIDRSNLVNSLIGNHVKIQGTPSTLDVGSHNKINQ